MLSLSHVIKIYPCIIATAIVVTVVEAAAIKMMDDIRRAWICIIPIEDDVFCRPLDEVKQDSIWSVPLE